MRSIPSLLIATTAAVGLTALIACKDQGPRPIDTGTGGGSGGLGGGDASTTCATAAATPSRATVPFNDDATFSFVLGTALRTPVNAAMAAKAGVFRDPDFGTQVARVTDRSIDGYAGPGITNEYSRADPENSDGTRVILNDTDGEWHLYDAKTFLRLRTLDIATGGETPEPRWDATDPNRFFYFAGTQLRSCNVATNQSALVHDFKADYPTAGMITTKSEGDASLDRNRWCLLVEQEDYARVAVVTYDRATDRIVGRKTSFRDGINWVSMTMSGSQCVIGYEDSDTDGDDITPPAEAFSTDFSSSVSLPTGANGHMDLALGANGRDVMVYQNNATDWIEMADLGTGAVTQLLAFQFAVNPDIDVHFSGNASGTPGWVLVASDGSRQPPSGSTHSWMDEQLFMLELKPNPRVWRIAQDQAYTSNTFSAEKNYFAECFGAINRAGTRIYFNSNWNNYTLNFAEEFVAVLPPNWNTRMPGG